MAKSSTVYVCQSCGQTYAKWQGQCTSCGEWNTLVEEIQTVSSKSKGNKKGSAAVRVSEAVLVPFSQVEPAHQLRERISTGITEFDRVLGQSRVEGTSTWLAGMVPGAVMLLGGEPGIGKSTLLTQVVVNLALQKMTAPQQSTSTNPKPVLYVCGEESPHQISLRIKRIFENEQKNNTDDSGKNWQQVLGDQIVFVTTTDSDEVVQVIENQQPKVVIIDSIQTLTTQELTGAAGSVGQLREGTERITQVVKRLHIPTFLVGHVTKEGTIAGPKVLEHIVDAVLELSGERTGELRLLRAIKNRFGATDEVGVFRFAEEGLVEVTNPSELFLEHTGQAVPGSAVVCVMEGTRPLLVEVQALVVSSQLAMPRRVGRGVELPRIQVLSAVLQKHAGLPLGSADVFLSAAGGFKVREPGVDLGLAVAMASSLKNKAIPPKTLFIGEVGLLGEIRKVSYLDRRIKEAKRLGFTTIISRESHTRVTEVLKKFGLS